MASPTTIFAPRSSAAHFPPSLAASTANARQSSRVTRAYRQASSLFLTRRLPEALSTILPVITPPSSSGTTGSDDADGVDPHRASLVRKQQPAAEGEHGSPTATAVRDDAIVEPAPVAHASRNTRIKVWIFYITLLNAIVELEPDEAKEAFGTRDWRALCAKVRDGGVWEEVVQNGYHGIEGDVDAEVVCNLATLLLAHARTQHLNQQRLETYLAASATPNLDLVSHDRFFAAAPNGSTSNTTTPRVSPRRNRVRSPSVRSVRSVRSARGGHGRGADTPRDLESRVKILELYTLHVLLRNDEWDYAREFIAASSVLDDERRDAFLSALEQLREEQAEEERRRREEVEKGEEEAKRQREEEEERERRRREEEERERERKEEAERRRRAVEVEKSAREEAASSAARGQAGRIPNGGPRANGRVTSGLGPRGQASSAGVKKAIARRQQQPGIAGQAAVLFASVRALVERLNASFAANPMLLLRTVAFIFGLVLMLSRADVRARIQRILGPAWQKIKRTVVMGASSL